MPTIEETFRTELKRLRDAQIKSINKQFKPLIKDVKKTRREGVAEIGEAFGTATDSLDANIAAFREQQAAVEDRLRTIVEPAPVPGGDRTQQAAAEGRGFLEDQASLQASLGTRLGQIQEGNFVGQQNLASNLQASSVSDLRNNINDILSKLRSERASQRGAAREQFQQALSQLNLQLASGGGASGIGGSGGGGGGGSRRTSSGETTASVAEQDAELARAIAEANTALEFFPEALAEQGHSFESLVERFLVTKFEDSAFFSAVSRREGELSQIRNDEILAEEANVESENQIALGMANIQLAAEEFGVPFDANDLAAAESHLRAGGSPTGFLETRGITESGQQDRDDRASANALVKAEEANRQVELRRTQDELRFDPNAIQARVDSEELTGAEARQLENDIANLPPLPVDPSRQIPNSPFIDGQGSLPVAPPVETTQDLLNSSPGGVLDRGPLGKRLDLSGIFGGGEPSTRLGQGLLEVVERAKQQAQPRRQGPSDFFEPQGGLQSELQALFAKRERDADLARRRAGTARQLKLTPPPVTVRRGGKIFS